MNKLSSNPRIPKIENENNIHYWVTKSWYGLNTKIFVCLQKRKIRQAILNNDFQETYKITTNFESISGRSKLTKNIKNYAAFKIIKNNFINENIEKRI